MIKTASLTLLASVSILAIDLSSATAQVYQVGGQTYQVEGRPAPAEPRAYQADPRLSQRQAQVQTPAPQRVVYSERQYGGGLIEMLFNGSQPYEQPRYAPQGQPGYQVEPRYELRQQQILPPMGPDQGYQREQTYQNESAIDPAHPAADPKFDKQMVNYDGREPAGTLVIDTPNRFLYLVQGNGRALRYGIGVGRPGFTWAGVKSISAKKEWPAWTPPPEMLKRRPDLPRFMDGGPDNPLGARAMYLGSSLYRIHGSNEPWTIGTAVSSGCIRMRNEDVIDLYGRVNVGARVIVI